MSNRRAGIELPAMIPFSVAAASLQESWKNICDYVDSLRMENTSLQNEVAVYRRSMDTSQKVNAHLLSRIEELQSEQKTSNDAKDLQDVGDGDGTPTKVGAASPCAGEKRSDSTAEPEPKRPKGFIGAERAVYDAPSTSVPAAPARSAACGQGNRMHASPVRAVNAPPVRTAARGQGSRSRTAPAPSVRGEATRMDVARPPPARTSAGGKQQRVSRDYLYAGQPPLSSSSEEEVEAAPAPPVRTAARGKSKE